MEFRFDEWADGRFDEGGVVVAVCGDVERLAGEFDGIVDVGVFGESVGGVVDADDEDVGGCGG